MGKGLVVNLTKEDQTSLYARGSNRIGSMVVKFLRSPAVYFLVLLISVGLAFGVSEFGYLFGVTFLAIVIGIPVVLGSVVNLRFGIIALFIVSYTLGLRRFAEEVPVGIALDVFLVAMLLGMLIDKWRKHDFTFDRNPISYVVWIWIIYNLLEFFNPVASREAWIYVIRGIALATR